MALYQRFGTITNIVFILDEVFGSLDPKNSAYVFNQILKLKKYFKYVIITSHTDHVWNTDNKIVVSF